MTVSKSFSFLAGRMRDTLKIDYIKKAPFIIFGFSLEKEERYTLFIRLNLDDCTSVFG